MDDYFAEMHDFVLRLYALRANHGEKYFLDKTPRYHLVAEDIIRMFPEGKFIFLWRNPLSIVSSMVNSFAKGRWGVSGYKVDLYDGFENLLSAIERHADRSCVVWYEDLVTDPQSQMERIFDYLEVEMPSNFDRSFFLNELTGTKGDFTGIKDYKSISDAPLDKWRATMNNPLRKAWCRRYLRWIGAQRLASAGYDLDDLLLELDRLPTGMKNIPTDMLSAAYGASYCMFEHSILMRKFKLIRSGKWKKVYVHT